ncbi:unnamed protein product [Plutella xylostella]|uniref:Cilia- and flagella-associated protein 45 n=1 Tax=Plutella xylostella TaxID=51655 RepID=A0A8S4FXC9_PLUXY|nr:unnamed protein product [Plutella xylostella]
MPKALKDLHEGIPYHHVTQGNEPGCYQLHRPSKCRLRFPITDRPIHKCEIPDYEYTMVPQKSGYRKLLVPRPPKNYYPTVMDRAEYERLKQQAQVKTKDEQLAALEAAEEAERQLAKESQERIDLLRSRLQAQPGAEAGAGGKDELEAPDQTTHTLNRAELLRADSLPGPRLASQVILASKCHAIRDAQLVEKQLIQQELSEEEKRLDAIMEENRVAALGRAEAGEARRRRLQLDNLAALKEQITAHDTAKIMEAERIEEESVRMNQANIAVQIDEANKLKEKLERQRQLKETLDRANAEIIYFKQLQNEEDRISNQRIALFLQQRQEREARARAERAAATAVKQKGIEHISRAQKAEQELKSELERIRNLKIQEDVEREYRRRERDAAVKRRDDMRKLHEARNNQIKDIHRMIAREIAKDEQSFNDAARQNDQFLQKEKLLEDERKARIEKHRQEIMKQINDKERARAEQREKIHSQGVALRMEQELQDKYEKMVIKQKVEDMRRQKIADKYVSEVVQTLNTHGYKITE